MKLSEPYKRCMTKIVSKRSELFGLSSLRRQVIMSVFATISSSASGTIVAISEDEEPLYCRTRSYQGRLSL